jgi:serine/threonine protein kinase/Tol biopolymer transport system component/tetratricopeptide (TPR) repeat protein
MKRATDKQTIVPIDPDDTQPANAYQAYQLARYHFHRVSFPDMLKSRACLEQALRLDDKFAPAYAGLAEQAVMEAITGLCAPADNIPKAREALRRAADLKLDSAEFYTVAGFVSLICDWNFSEAEAQLHKALALNRHHTFAYKYLGEALMFQGRSHEAETSLRRALEIEPMSLHVGMILTLAYFLARNYERLIEECERLLAMYPRFFMAATYRCLAWEQLGRADEAIAEYERILREPDGEIARRFMGYAYALVGDRDNALRTIEKLEIESRQHYLSPTFQANIYAALNEEERALSCLGEALSDRDPWLLLIGTDPRLDSLRRHPRFNKVLREVGLGHLAHAETRDTQSKPRPAMPPERWQRIETVFHEALGCEPAKRKQFLEAECAGDEALRHEVESLLSSLGEADDFIERPPGDVAAELLGTNQAALEHGQQIENYRIVRQLGSGGMGEVYLAEDIRLKRKVALKLLPAHFIMNPDRVRRFEREARAASALNHPNIVTIYEIGHSGSTHFIATEFVDGKTLRQLINEKPFTLNETLNVSMQVADALSGAHAAGIVHRDIKPENIMIRRDGYVKILDFGLAKLTEQQTINSDLETPTLLQSNPGLVMGTVQYMSPEQARGRNVGIGTDIWSLGIVMYELLCGHVPFTGETPSHVMVSLMEDKLPPVKDYANVPSEVEQFVTRALRKNQSERYRTAGELARELKAFKQKLQQESRFKMWLKTIPSRKEGVQLPPIGPLTAVSAVHQIPIEKRGAVETTPLQTHSTSSAEYQPNRFLTLKRVAVGGVLAVLVGVFAIAVYRNSRRAQLTKQTAAPFQINDFVKVTNAGLVRDSAISADGRYIGYVGEEKGKAGIHLRDVASNNEWEVIAPTRDHYYGLTFSPDGAFLYYTVKPPNNSIAALYRVGVPHGEAAKLIVDVDGPVSFSPDGQQIVFVRGSTTGERALIVASAGGTGEHKIASRTGFGAFSFGGPAWSPDGKTVACGASFTDDHGRFMTVVGVNVTDGSVNILTKQKWRTVGRVWWVNNGEGIIFSGNDLETRSALQLWFVSAVSGESRRITSDLQDYDGVSLTADSATLITRERHALIGLWIVPNADTARGNQILSNVDDLYQGDYTRSRFSWTPDGRIIYSSELNGVPTIRTVAADGTEHKQVTRGPGGNAFPSVSSDSQHIVFVSDRTGRTNIWTMNIDGTNEKQLTYGEDDSWAWCSPDARWVVYHTGDQGRRTIRRIPIVGGDSEQLTDYTSLLPVVSPDGQWISAYYRAQPKAPWQIAIIPFNGGPPARTFDLPRDVVFQSLVRWTPNGDSLAYIVYRDGVSNIWTQPITGGTPKQLTDFKSDEILWFDWSRDGQQLAVSRGTITSDIVMIHTKPASSQP